MSLLKPWLYLLAAHAEAQAPHFVDRLKNLTVREGDPVVLSAQASGVPLPMMAWQKDGRMIATNDRTYRVSAAAAVSVTVLGDMRRKWAWPTGW